MPRSIFDELDQLYSDIDNRLASEELAARAKARTKREQSIAKKRKLNDQAYFLFMFTRLEGRIKAESDSLIDDKFNSSAQWQQKRAWDILHKRKQERKLQFMERTGLMVPMGGTEYGKIKSYYDERNTIAHGGGFANPLSLPTVISDMKHLYKAVRHK